MKPMLIVGGGLGGILVARLLKERGIPFHGLEMGPQLAREAHLPHNRFHEQNSLRFLTQRLPCLEWKTAPGPALRLTNGNWEGVSSGVSTELGYFIQSPFFYPTISFPEMFHSLASDVQTDYLLSVAVVNVCTKSKVISTNRGHAFGYEKIIWCGPLKYLSEVLRRDPLIPKKLLSTKTAGRVGVIVDSLVKYTGMACEHTLLFSYRYKEARRDAIGLTRIGEGKAEWLSVRWLLLLEDEFSENKEAVAGCVRAFRREFGKELPMKSPEGNERIVYVTEPLLLGRSIYRSDLRVTDDTFYVGPEICISESNRHYLHLDQTIANFQYFEKTLWS